MKIENVEKILVVEDNERHADATIKQLEHYDLTIAHNYKAALQAIVGTYIQKTIAGYPDVVKIAFKFPKTPKYDVVLTDMYFPESLGTSEETLGLAVAMIAAKASTPAVAIVSATNHHINTLSETFAYLMRKEPMHIEDTRFMYFDDDSFGTRDEPKRWDLALESLCAGENVYK